LVWMVWFVMVDLCVKAMVRAKGKRKYRVSPLRGGR
jgi:hypothetical protein